MSVVIQGNHSTHGHYILKYLKQVCAAPASGRLPDFFCDPCWAVSVHVANLAAECTFLASLQMAIITPYAEITYTYTARWVRAAPGFPV